MAIVDFSLDRNTITEIAFLFPAKLSAFMLCCHTHTYIYLKKRSECYAFNPVIYSHWGVLLVAEELWTQYEIICLKQLLVRLSFLRIRQLRATELWCCSLYPTKTAFVFYNTLQLNYDWA